MESESSIPPKEQQQKPESGLEFPRHFTKEGSDPYEEIEWEKREISITNEDGDVLFRQEDVEVPKKWSQTAANIVISKYFHGQVGTPERETSVRQLVERVVKTMKEWGIRGGYFASNEDAEVFHDELAYLLLNQYASFNSPVWFNCGIEEQPQCSACFINSVEDTMDSILHLARTEGRLFKYGSGTGTNFSPLRSSRAKLSGGGTASGPVSFMKGFDAFAGVIKSGGKTRRAAKMVILDIDHPDIVEFIECKAKEERKAWSLIDSGYNGSVDGDAYSSIFFQNANNSVRVTDEFMESVEQDGIWATRERTTNQIVDTYQARELMQKIAESCHACGDPGMQFDSTINRWHTCKNTARINASNPCSEYMFLDDSACNLASFNLLKFVKPEGEFDVESFRIAARKGPFSGYAKNRDPFLDVMRMHRAAVQDINAVHVPDNLIKAAQECWDLAVLEGTVHGFRNAQTSVLAPTGTIGFMMDCDTTGVEPDLALVKFKKMVGGGMMKIVNNTVPSALSKLGYEEKEVVAITKYIDETGTIEGAPAVKDEHLAVFDCAFKAQKGSRSIDYMGHIKMMAAVQPFISGAISKTVNVPEDISAELLGELYMQAWKLGVKAIAVYRDNSKKIQPLNLTQGGKVTDASGQEDTNAFKPVRRKLPAVRNAMTHKFSIGGHEGYITVGMYDDGQPGEIFLVMAKEGSAISGLMDSFATAISLALQYGVPLKVLIDKFSHVRFEPSGHTGNREIPFAKSIVDYIFRWLASKFLSTEEQRHTGIHVSEPENSSETVATASSSSSEGTPEDGAAGDMKSMYVLDDAPSCAGCGSIMVRNGSCYKCMNCGETSGCS
ncbi:MAG: hypothetical protein P8Z37_12205 [Acidobacteriota bacterium]